MNLGGRTALVTGASGGLGHAIARALARRGADVVLTGRRAEVLEPLAAELRGRAVPCDLSDRDSVARLVEEAGPVDVLVANAGLPGSGAIDSLTVEEIDRALDVNLRAPIILARLMCEGMAERGGGHIVFVSSLNGKVGTARTSVYSATKFGLRGFAQGLREDLRPRGVGVSTVLPGFIRDAGLFHDSGGQVPAYVGTRTPEDVADARGVRNRARPRGGRRRAALPAVRQRRRRPRARCCGQGPAQARRRPNRLLGHFRPARQALGRRRRDTRLRSEGAPGFGSQEDGLRATPVRASEERPLRWLRHLLALLRGSARLAAVAEAGGVPAPGPRRAGGDLDRAPLVGRDVRALRV